jgi:hypothetical protein
MFPGKPVYDDEVLFRYLVGDLPEEQAERFDELSIVDNEFAVCLQTAENELVDAYVRHELSGQTLEKFKSIYLSSPVRRHKVRFAEAMLNLQGRASLARAHTSPGSVPFPLLKKRSSFLRSFALSRLALQWGFALAAAVVALAAGYLFVQNRSLEGQLAEGRSRQSALSQREKQLQSELGEQRSANAEMLKQLAQVRDSIPQTGALNAITVLLLPMTRGAGQPVVISVPTGSNLLPLRLRLESDDYPQYVAVLKDPATDRVVWQSGKLKPEHGAKYKDVVIRLPSFLLREQNYSVELSGLSSSGLPELITNYVFRVELG